MASTDNNTSDATYLAETYRQRTHRDQILDAPDSYIGSIQSIEQPTWLVSHLPTVELPCPPIEQVTVSYHPGLYKLMDEAIVNCRDQYIRMMQSALPDKKLVSYIHVQVCPDTGTITLENDGDGIDIAQHPDTHKWIPEMIFANLLTSTNYNTQEKRITGGKNGLGIKLVMIWSTYARIETVDHRRKLRYVQNISENMSVISAPVITPVKGKTVKPMTKITFRPDYARLGLTGLSADMQKVFAKRLLDICGTTELIGKMTVTWNDVPIPIHKFQQYIQCFPIADMESLKYEKAGERWEYAVTLSTDQQFHQISFVNGIATFRGGRHVDYIVNQILKKMGVLAAKKKIEVTPKFQSQLKHQMTVFIRCDIENPSFDSQTKEFMTTPDKQFGSSCEVSDGFVDKLMKLGFLERIQSIAEGVERRENKKMDGAKTKTVRVEKLEDANHAGTIKSGDCRLILGEGDSAVSGIKSGFSANDKNIYGLYPVGGKILNVLNATPDKIRANEEICAIIKTLGLKWGATYTAESVKKDLRYGGVILASDQDYDGSHIKGLEINFFLAFWPSLAAIDGFISYLNTPVQKATKGNNVLSFYNEGEFQSWKRTLTDKEYRKWHLKYYKGLGTSTSKEFKEYMQNLKLVKFCLTPECKNMVEMVFMKSRVPERKEWMRNYERGVYVNTSQPVVSYAEFIQKELIHFSIYSCERAIANVMDGLKTGQRKVLRTELTRPQTSEIKVAQLAGRVSEQMDYHHGEASLASTIINQAQSYVGSNNIAYLQPIGQFGTRLKNGADSASPRYIFTKLDPIAKTILLDKDDPILTYLYDGAEQIEPTYYYPVLPMVLVNGTEGIGTGFSSTIPSYNPLDIVANIRSRLLPNDGSIQNSRGELIPYYEQFLGSVIKSTTTNSYITKGVYSRPSHSQTTIIISELPIGTGILPYRDWLNNIVFGTSSTSSASASAAPEKSVAENKKTTIPIASVRDNSTELCVHFEIEVKDAALLDRLESEVDSNGVNKIEKALNLTSVIHLSNMYLFDSDHRLTKYESPDEIIDAYFPKRLQAYARRREYQLEVLRQTAHVLSHKVRYIELCLDGTIQLNRKTDEEVEQLLFAAKLDKLEDSYDYLLSMRMNAVTAMKVAALKDEHRKAVEAYQVLHQTTPSELWLHDLEKFEAAYQIYKSDRALPYEEERAAKESKAGIGKGTKGGAAKEKVMKQKPAAKRPNKRREAAPPFQTHAM